VKALEERRGTAPTHSWPLHYMGVSGQRHALTALYPWGKDTRYPLYRRLGGPQSRSGHRGYRKNPLPLPGIEHRSPGHPVRSQTLYWLSYPGTLPITRTVRKYSQYFTTRSNGNNLAITHSCRLVFLNPLKPTYVYILFKNSVRTSKRTLLATITNINLLTLFKEIIAIYAENHT
jgi:hypothetical protein